MIKRMLLIMLGLLLLLSSATAESSKTLEQADFDVYFENQIIDVPTYIDGKTVYVSLNELLKALGGTYTEQGGKVVISLTPTSEKTVTNEGNIYEDDHISVKFSGFQYFSKDMHTGHIVAVPKIVITNKTSETIKFKLDWQKFFMNGCHIQIANTDETEVQANGKLSFPSAFLCVVDLGEFENYGESVIKHIEMDVDLKYGRTTQRVTWVIDCDIDVDSIQP